MPTPTSRNPTVGRGVKLHPKHNLYTKKGLHRREFKPPQAKHVEPEDHHATKTVKIGGNKNAGERVVPVKKAPKFYPSEDVKQPKISRKSARRGVLRPSLTPGTVVILLAGRFRGRRAVLLKQLDSGLLLVTGPFKLNGVPLRRVSATYVIATKTKVDIATVKIDEKLNDAYFSKEKKTREQRGKEKEFFAENGEKQKKKFPESKLTDQKDIDKPLVAAINGTPNLAKYLSTSFSLSRNDQPHLMSF